MLPFKFSLVALAFFFVKMVAVGQSPTADSLPYDFDQPSRVIFMPSELREISGISETPKTGTLAAIGDEKGSIFFLNLHSHSIDNVVTFREKGDFEDLVMLGDSVWCQKSNGDLYLVKDLKAEKPTSQVFKSGFIEKKRDDVEGLCFDPPNNRLILACKGVSDSFFVRRFFAFDLKTHQFSPEPVFTIDPHFVEKVLARAPKGKPFSPAAIGVQPQTGEFYIISSVGKMLIILDSAGGLKHAVKLDKEMLPQPEGMAFDPDGTLYISSEGKRGEGVILVFEKKKP